MREGMVVAVPVFAKGEKAEAREVVALDRQASDFPSLMTGFVAGSLAIIWPWKDKSYLKNEAGEFIMKQRSPEDVPEKVLSGYENWHLPDLGDSATWIAIALIVMGGIAIWAIEKYASDTENTETESVA